MLAFLFALSLVVIDGDTVRLGQEKIRLENIDAPETQRPRAQCDYEIQLGLKSKQALIQILAGGEPVVLRSGRLDRYGRTLARIEVNRKDVGQTLIEMRLAQPWVGRKAEWCQ